MENGVRKHPLIHGIMIVLNNINKENIMGRNKDANSILVSLSMILLLGIMLHITGCRQHKNPLLAAKQSEAVKFLINAENYASNKKHLYYFMESVYLTCVQDPQHFDNPFNPNEKNPCKSYLNTMTDYAQQTKQFKGLKVNDLTDPVALKKLEKPLFEAII